MKCWTEAFRPKTAFRDALLLSGLALSACADPGPYYAGYSGYDYYPGYDYSYYGYGPAVGFDFRSGGFRRDNFHRTHGEQRAFLFAPTFLTRFFQNNEITAATALVTATDMGGRQLFTGTAPVRLRAVGDMFWGTDFKYAPFIASWVTPHDPEIERILADAKEYMPGRRLPGYERNKNAAAQERSTLLQARAIYQACGFTCVKRARSRSFGKALVDETWELALSGTVGAR